MLGLLLAWGATGPAAGAVAPSDTGQAAFPPAWARPVRADSGAVPAPGRAAPSPPAPAPADSVTGGDYWWVVRTALGTPRDCDLAVARATAAGVRGVLVQVVGRADAYYRSDLLPRAEPLGNGEFDPLGYLLPRAHAAGLEVHAWMNCFLAWSAPRSPRDTLHVVHRHPDWLTWARPHPGRRTARRRGPAGRRGAEMWAPEGEGFYLVQANPEVRTFLARVAAEICRRYDVDGIHLDYVRYPAADVTIDPVTREAYNRFAAADSSSPGAADSAGADRRRWEVFRQAQVAAFVAEIRDTLREARPEALLSAAVLADTISARRNHGQDWPAWLRSGRVDRVFPMCYQASTRSVMDQLSAFRANLGSAQVVPGLACYNQTPRALAQKIRVAREMGFSSIALYSYDSLYAQRGYPRELERWRAESGAGDGVAPPGPGQRRP